MIYFTAAHGEFFVRTAVTGLLRSFRVYNPDHRIIVFCRNPEWLRPDVADFEIRSFELTDLLKSYDEEFYQRPGMRCRTNVFKFSLFQRLSREFPDETLCWIDADTLVLDNLSRHLQQGRLNVISHGRRDREIVDCGNGLLVPGHQLAIGALYAIPAGACCDELVEIASERPTWHGQGDQVIRCL